jgi:hypothetical protein
MLFAGGYGGGELVWLNEWFVTNLIIRLTVTTPLEVGIHGREFENLFFAFCIV